MGRELKSYIDERQETQVRQGSRKHERNRICCPSDADGRGLGLVSQQWKEVLFGHRETTLSNFVEGIALWLGLLCV